jgi:hypothetical protein
MPGTTLLPGVFCDDLGWQGYRTDSDTRTTWHGVGIEGARSTSRGNSVPPDFYSRPWKEKDLSSGVLDDTTNLQEAAYSKTSPTRGNNSLLEDEELMFMSTCPSTPMMLMSTSTSISTFPQSSWQNSSCGAPMAEPMEENVQEHGNLHVRPISAPGVLSSASGARSELSRAAPPSECRRDLSQELGERSLYGDGDIEDNISVLSRAESDSLDEIPTSIAISLMSLQNPCVV